MTPDWFLSADPAVLARQTAAPPPGVDRAPVARRARLFAAACVRQVWDWLPREARNAVEVSERFADGRATENDLRAVAIRRVQGPVDATQFAIAAAGCAAGRGTPWDFPAGLSGPAGRPAEGEIPHSPLEAARLSAHAAANNAALAAFAARTSAAWHDAWNAAYHAARATQAHILRDIFPPPGYTPAFRPEWRTSAVLDLARAMDEAGDFSAGPILADALQDSGCDDDVMLNQLRHPGPHVRGCWPVDTVLGRG